MKTHPAREAAAPACKLQAQRDRTVDAQADKIMPGLFTRDSGSLLGVGTSSFSIMPTGPKSFGTSGGSIAKIGYLTDPPPWGVGAKGVWKFGSGSR